ncbi:hypothetical protein [Brevundimonas aurifodinae]|uniref:Uncharacterized protein n=2 Tax=Brevundimonas TaxID=41275 RepID=A0ABV1NRE4_9CAUL|nr:MAG: hypothetical protein B7Z42_07635 [Brevundimonas sp. 12-68-7]OYX34976.1 MAG: hypothetical protein B7Z01_03575 [Brevundimonas subvibrioides]
MSQHNIVGSEAFNRTPPLIIRKVRTRALRRRQARAVWMFVAGAGVTAIAGVVAVLAMVGPGLAGG